MTAFALPPDLVRSMLSAPSGVDVSKEKEERDTTRLNGTAEALWRAAFGLLAATALRDDLAAAAVPARAVRQAATRAAISRKEVGARVGPYDARHRRLVVLLAGEVYDETEGALVGPCVLAPRDAAAAASRLFGADPARAAAGEARGAHGRCPRRAPPRAWGKTKMQRCAARPCSRTRPRKASAAKTRGRARRRVACERARDDSARAVDARGGDLAARRPARRPRRFLLPRVRAFGREHLLPAEGDQLPARPRGAAGASSARTRSC